MKKKEIWVPIRNYEAYEVSNHGRFRALPKTVNSRYKTRFIKMKMIKLAINNVTNYTMISLYNSEGRKSYTGHKIVALHFVSNPNNYPIINHRDCNKQNNYFENLEWCTYKYNHAHAVKNGKYDYLYGENHYNSKIKNKDIPKIFELNKVGKSNKEIAEIFKCNSSNIGMILRGESRKTLKNG